MGHARHRVGVAVFALACGLASLGWWVRGAETPADELPRAPTPQGTTPSGPAAQPVAGDELRAAEAEEVSAVRAEVVSLDVEARVAATVAADLAATDELVLHGIALDEDGRPIADAAVFLGSYGHLHWTSAEPPWTHQPVTATGPDGRFAVRARPDGNEALRIDAPGFAPEFTAFEAGRETPATACEVTLARTASMVMDLGHQTEEERARTWATLTAGAPPLVLEDGSRQFAMSFSMSELRWRAQPDGAGRARVDRLPPYLRLQVAVDGAPELRWIEHPEVTLEPGEVRVLRLAPGSAALVTGTLSDEHGAALGQVGLALLPGEAESWDFEEEFRRHGERLTETDAGGRFRFDDVPDGTWTVGPGRASGLLLAPLALRIEAGRQERALDLVGALGESIEGQVLSRAGEPMPDVEVIAKAVDAWRVARATTDVEGAFRLGPLAIGEYLLALDIPGGTPLLDESNAVRVASGTQGVVLHPPETGALRVRLVDAASGADLSGRVLLGSLDERGIPTGGRMESVEAGDELELAAVPPGRWSLTAWTPEGQVAVLDDVRVDIGVERAITLAAAPGAYVRIVGTRETHFVWAVREGAVVGLSGFDGSGDGETDPGRMLLPAGPVTILAIDMRAPDDPPARHPFEVEPGSEAQVVDLGAGD